MRHRSDSSQKAIVAALREAGAFVYCIGRPVDLLVFYRGWHLLECKTPGRKRKDQESQDAFCKAYDVPRITNAAEALQAVGATAVSHIEIARSYRVVAETTEDLTDYDALVSEMRARRAV